MGRSLAILAALVLPCLVESGFWRMNCGKIQTGRIDPVVSPGKISAHVHNIVGGYNIGISSTYEDLVESKCTSCEIAVDKSAYWAPQLYYQYANGSFSDVPNEGMIVYYLGRADDGNGLTAFPPGFRMLSGLTFARSYDNTTKTWDGSRNIADRVSFVCINPDATNGQYDSPNMQYTDCPNGMRAQIHFQSCWDGVNLYKTDNSHMAYLSDIDNGICPSTHPVKFINLFYEVYYRVNEIAKEDGGRFVFANGDTTGYGFHGDFVNGWDNSTLGEALKECAPGPNGSGEIDDCAPLVPVDSTTYSETCPERSPLVDEQVKGLLEKLPGCNEVTSGPEAATLAQTTCPASVVPPSLNPFVQSTLEDVPVLPVAGDVVNGWEYLGSITDAGNAGGVRPLSAALFRDDTMTIGECQKSCNAAGFTFAGLENDDECWCDNTLQGGATIEKTGATALNSLTCPGNVETYCGGPGTLMVYQKVGESQASATESAASSTSSSAAVTSAAASSSKTSSSVTVITSSTSAFSNSSATITSVSNSSIVSPTSASEASFSSLSSVILNATTTSFNSSRTSTITVLSTSAPFANTTSFTSSSFSTITVSTTSAPFANTTTTFSTASASSTLPPTGTPVANSSIAGHFIYHGCYDEDTSRPGRALSGSSYSSKNVTNEACASFCASKNYRYFGTEFGDECYCGNSLKLGASLDATGCTAECAGSLDSSSPFAAFANVCGGSDVLSVWENKDWTPVLTVSNVSGNSTYTSQGCYADSPEARILSDAGTDSDAMTVEKCVSYCSSKGYPFAGLEYASECFCGATLKSGSSKVDDQNLCNMVCSGNSLEYCGGNGAMNLYKSKAVSRIRRGKRGM